MSDETVGTSPFGPDGKFDMGDVVNYEPLGITGVVVDHMLSGNNSYYRIVWQVPNDGGKFRGPARWVFSYYLTATGQRNEATYKRYQYLKNRGLQDKAGTCTCKDVEQLVIENRRLRRELEDLT